MRLQGLQLLQQLARSQCSYNGQWRPGLQQCAANLLQACSTSSALPEGLAWRAYSQVRSRILAEGRMHALYSHNRCSARRDQQHRQRVYLLLVRLHRQGALEAQGSAAAPAAATYEAHLLVTRHPPQMESPATRPRA
jgi:hypothetical protein